MTTPNAPASMYRTTEGLGIWEHRGKVAAVGVGHSPTSRRWDGKPETCVGANSILALRQAIEDWAIDGLKAGSPMGSTLEPEDLTGTAVYLASDDSRLMTGQTLVVDAGVWMNG